MLNLAHAYQSGDGANANLQVANDYVKQCTNLGNRSCGSYAGNIQGDIDTQQKLGAMQGDVNRWRNCGWVNNYKYSIFNGGMYADKSYQVVDFLINEWARQHRKGSRHPHNRSPGPPYAISVPIQSPPGYAFIYNKALSQAAYAAFWKAIDRFFANRCRQ